MTYRDRIRALRGVKFGRPKTAPPENFEEILKEWREGKITAVAAARKSGLSRSTFYRRVHELWDAQ